MLMNGYSIIAHPTSLVLPHGPPHKVASEAAHRSCAIGEDMVEYRSDYFCHTRGVTMRTITVKLEDDLAEALERLYRQEGFYSKSALVREALRQWLIARRKRELKSNLELYLQDRRALREAADEVESRMLVTEEALARN